MEITTLNEKYSLQKPIKVNVSRDGSRYLGKIAELNMYATGSKEEIKE